MNPDPNQNEASPAETVANLVVASTVPKRHWRPSVAECLFAIFLLVVLGGVCLPVFNSVSLMGPQTRALAQAKQIGLALKLFAGDHDGNFPKVGVPDLMAKEPADSNAAFACLFPTYTQSERIFGIKESAYQTRVPDDIIDASDDTGTPRKTLEPGENAFGYMMGLTDKSDPAALLVADGTDGSGHYNTFPQVRGGTWGVAKRAIVVHVNNSASLESLKGPDNSLYIPRTCDPEHNALDAGYLGAGTRFLDPAIAGP